MSYKLVSFFLLAVSLFSSPVFTSQVDIQYSQLKNGLEVYVVPNHRIPAVLHSVIYKVGGMDDPIGKTGLAHYFEHLMFKTMGKFKDISATMDSIGAKYNAYTTTDHTCYWELVLKEDLPLAMEIEADRMANFNLGELNNGRSKIIDNEKDIVLAERKMHVDNQPETLLYEEINNLFYRTGYGRPVIGWETDINSFCYNDIKSFHNNYYHSGNAILLVVGDVEFAEILKLAEEKYGHIKSQPAIRNYPNHEPVYSTNMLLTLQSSQTKVPVLNFRYKVPKFNNTKEGLMVDLAVHKLGGSKSSRLYKDLVFDKNIAVSVFAHYHGMTFSDGFVDVMVYPKDGVGLDMVEKELENSISNFIHEGMTEEELKNAKYQYRVAQFDNLSSLESIAIFYISHLALNTPLKEIDISHSQVNNISLEDVNSKISTIFSSNKLVGRLLPQGDVTNENK